MSSEPNSVKRIFAEAVEQYSPDQWDAYLNQACGDDAQLRRRVEALLEAHAADGSLLDRPAVVLAPTAGMPPIAERPGTTIGRYKLLEEIGEGGMGVVYMAEQREPVRRKVALKIIKPGMDTREVIARFEAERQALAMMDHPNIAKVLDGGTTGEGARDEGRGARDEGRGADGGVASSSLIPHPSSLAPAGRPYFVMELVQGIPITEYCDQAGLTTRKRLELFVQVCQAVHHAHQKGIIHRDLKPSNVLVTLYDGVPVPKIIDFGIAKAIQSAEKGTGPICRNGPEGASHKLDLSPFPLAEKSLFTGHGRMMGTPMYMSPEQAEMSGLDVDTRSDIYSLGVLLYELLTGSTPFDQKRIREAAYEEIRRMIREEEPPRPSHRLSTLDGEAISTVTAHRGVDARRLGRLLRGDLDWIVMKALEKDRTRRYESASAFAADVQRYLADEPVRAKPAGLLVRLKKWTKRHKAVTAVAAAVLLAAAIFGTATAVQAYQRDVRLTAMATEGVADVRVAMAQQEFGRAQRRATEIQAELAAAPKVKAQFGPELEGLLHQAEARLRLQRFENLAREARFSANRLLARPELRDPAEARRRCQEALAVFHVLDNDRWLEDLERLPLDRAEVTQIKQLLVELLFLLASIEVRPPEGAPAVRRATALLDTVETLAPNLYVLYEYRSRCRAILGDQEAARSDSQRAGTMQRNTWLDHYFRAIELRPTNSADALREAEAAITFRPDDYWSWFVWSDLQWYRGFKDLAYWGFSICIRLRPEEPMAWTWRARSGGDRTTLEKIADLSRALELTTDPTLRVTTYRLLANRRMDLGQAEAALSDCNSALRLDPHGPGAFICRAKCYRALGQLENARADARRVVEVTEKNTDYFWARDYRLSAFAILGQPQEAAELALAVFTNERLRDWAPVLEANVEMERIPQKAFALAMARWKLGDKDQARRWYEKGVQWMDKKQNPDPLHFLDDKDLPRFRDEAAALLGIPVKPPAGKEKPK